VGSFAVLAAVIDLDATFFFQLGVFLTLLVVLHRLAFRPMMALFDRRRAETDDRVRKAIEGSQEAERLTENYTREMGAVAAKGAEKKARAREAALRAVSELLSRERAAAAAWMEGELAKASREIDTTRNILKGEVEGLASQLTTMLVESPSTPPRPGS